MFSSKSFIVPGFAFIFLINFEFIFVYGVRKCSKFILLHAADQFSQHHLLKRLSFLHYVFLPPLSKISCPWVHAFISGLPVLLHWSVFLFLCQYHTALMTAALECSPKSVRLSPPAPFFLKIVSIIWSLLYSHMNTEIFCSTSVKNAIVNWIEIAQNL